MLRSLTATATKASTSAAAWTKVWWAHTHTHTHSHSHSREMSPTVMTPNTPKNCTQGRGSKRYQRSKHLQQVVGMEGLASMAVLAHIKRA